MTHIALKVISSTIDSNYAVTSDFTFHDMATVSLILLNFWYIMSWLQWKEEFLSCKTTLFPLFPEMHLLPHQRRLNAPCEVFWESRIYKFCHICIEKNFTKSALNEFMGVFSVRIAKEESVQERIRGIANTNAIHAGGDDK